MKNLILTISTLITLTSFVAIASMSAADSASTQTSLECRHGQCNATAASTGKRCLHCVSNAGDLYCWQH
jgi:hypothetical protein